MSRIYLVRHASHDRVRTILCGRMPGIVLGAAGLKEAAALAERLRDSGATLVLSSPRERALATADAIAGALGQAIAVAQELDEIAFGDWTGRSFAELADDPLWRFWNTSRAIARAPGGESMAEAQGRVLGLLERLKGTCVLVSHCDVIRAVLLKVLGLSLDAYDRLAVDPGSLSLIEYWPGGGRLLGLNERPATA
ncbi:histidine phosphatase family protein [Methylobacterium soli]|uniref:Histidine phosphatase family protein n=1 Tax=Methylobacterium soli TaxID=553447 RepID=A0A6L3T6G3_9HYPH|nr:histidine phosphatase family protein [Methylobacterium soli]KAB1080971.1 histidine phosphatase family protein [Methylobacterium soli]GJE41160.1 Putative phosphoserine phosphatase 2 [Methylobacterium soli]